MDRWNHYNTCNYHKIKDIVCYINLDALPNRGGGQMWAPHRKQLRAHRTFVSPPTCQILTPTCWEDFTNRLNWCCNINWLTPGFPNPLTETVKLHLFLSERRRGFLLSVLHHTHSRAANYGRAEMTIFSHYVFNHFYLNI